MTRLFACRKAAGSIAFGNIEFEKLEEIEHQIIAFEENPYIVLRNVPD